MSGQKVNHSDIRDLFGSLTVSRRSLLWALRALVGTLGMTLAMTASAASEYFVVLGSFASASSAHAEGRRAAEDGVDIAVREAEAAGGETRYRVLAGPYSSYAGADQARAQMDRDDTWIVQYELRVMAAAEAAIVAQREVAGEAAVVAQREVNAPAAADKHVDAARPRRSSERDVLGRQGLLRRGVPADLNRGVTPQVTEESLDRYLSTRPQATDRILPHAPLPPADSLSARQSVTLQDVQFSGGGGSILAAFGSEIEAMVAPLRGRAVATEDVLKLKNQINQLLVTEGFVNSGVLIPDQRVTNGVVRLDVVEGRVDQVNVRSTLRPAWVSQRLDTGEPFNLKTLQASLKLLEKEPLVRRVHARVVPGQELGLADLELDVETVPFHRVGFGAANDRSPSIGAEHGEVWFASNNLSNFADKLYLGTSVTEGLDAYSASYTLPVNRFGHEVTVAYSQSDSTVIEEPFTAVDIESETTGGRLSYKVPLHRTLESELALDLTLERRRNFTTLLGLPYSFSEGAVNGESRVAPIRLGMSWVHQGLARSMAARLVVSRGTTGYDATQHSDRADGRFTAALAQFQYSQQLFGKVHGTVRLLGQVSDDALLSIERVALGGMGTVRGYRQNQLVRDNAFLMSLELRWRLHGDNFRADLVTFYDWGVGENDDGAATSDADNISSLGVGLTAQRGGLRGELFWAFALEDIHVAEQDLQDKGIHLKVSYEYRF